MLAYVHFKEKMVDRNMFGVCLFNLKSAIWILLFGCCQINASIDGE